MQASSMGGAYAHLALLNHIKVQGKYSETRRKDLRAPPCLLAPIAILDYGWMQSGFLSELIASKKWNILKIKETRDNREQ
jgi:hypothetical protein